MKKTITILAAMLFFINMARSQWVEVGINNYALNANNIIYAVITDAAGNVYAAGAFTDSTVHSFVARWTGDSIWVPLDTNTLHANGYIYSLAADKAGNIYAAGAFTDRPFDYEGNIYVAKWNGTHWSELGTGGISPVTNAYGSAIYSLAVDDSGYVYAAGEFKDANNKYYVAKWNGAAWSELGTGSNAINANYYIHNIVTDHSGNIYAAGAFADSPAYRYDAGGAIEDSSGYEYVAQWNGAKWTEMGTGSNALYATSPIRALATDPSGHVYVAYDDTAANFYVAQWNGTNWDKVGTGSNALNANNNINALTTDLSGHLYAAGNFTDVNGKQYVAKWNGINWQELGTGNDALDPDSYILTIATDTAYNVYAAGYFIDGNSKYYVSEYDPNTQGASGIRTMAVSSYEVSIAPNPSGSQANITLTVATDADLSVAIYDMTGREIKTIYNGPIAAGGKNIVFDAGALSSGIYLVTVSDGTSSAQQRFVKL